MKVRSATLSWRRKIKDGSVGNKQADEERHRRGEEIEGRKGEWNLNSSSLFYEAFLFVCRYVGILSLFFSYRVLFSRSII